MPIHRGNDRRGPYYQWGQQHKYYYETNNNVSRIKAYKEAVKQAKAIFSNEKYKKWQSLE